MCGEDSRCDGHGGWQITNDQIYARQEQMGMEQRESPNMTLVVAYADIHEAKPPQVTCTFHLPNGND